MSAVQGMVRAAGPAGPGLEGVAGLSREPREHFLRRTIGRVADLARRLAGAFPLTITGLIILALAAASFAYLGVTRLDLVVLAVAALGIVLTLLAMLLVSLVSLVVWLRLRRPEAVLPLTLECGSRQPSGFIAPLPRWLPLVEVSWTWRTPREVEVAVVPGHHGLAELVRPAHRGITPAITRTILVRDLMGLAAITWGSAEDREVRIAPWRGALDRMPLLDGLVGGEDLSDPRGAPHGDRVDMRQYTRGDSPRLILWKVYARTRKLLVRVPERACTARPRACAYLVVGDGDEASASLARVVVERGLLGDAWALGVDGSLTPATNPAAALDSLIASGNVVPGAASALPAFLLQASREGFSICLTFLPARDGPWVAGVRAALRQTSLRVHLLTAVDGGTRRRSPAAGWRRIVLRPLPGAVPDLDDLARMARHFEGLGCQFTAVDRAGGRILGDPRRFAVGPPVEGRRP